MSSISGFSPASLPSALSTGQTTIAAGNQQLNQDAQQIANPANQNLTDPLLDLNQALLLTQAGAAVIHTANKMVGTLLDVFT
jgi:hypothetical protein